MKRHHGLLKTIRTQLNRATHRSVHGRLGFAVLRIGCQSVGVSPRHSRRGSTLLVVMAMLGMLMLLGVLYFTFAAQEQQNATNFADAAKRVDDPGDDIEAIFDEMLKQLIQGPSYEQKQSVLWGGRHSLAYGMIGQDLQPYNGTGVNVHLRDDSSSPKHQLVVDQDRNGVNDTDQSLLELNDSPAARLDLSERRVETLPAPDVDYTYPDHNNAWLAYIGTTWKTPSNAAPTGYPVIKPSFHRPEFFRDNDGMPISDWETTSGGGGVPFSTRGRLFRPHPDHLYVPSANQTVTPPVRRFLSDYNPADAGDIASLSTIPPGRGFPFTKVPATGPVGPVTHRKQGVWSLVALPPNPPFNFPAYEFDVDNDNDGTPDSIWMDLGLPVMVRSDNKTYVPLVAVLIQDLDSLLNLNAIGNLSGDTRTTASSNFGNNQDIHRSAQGLSPSEINPEWALDTRPNEAASLSDHTSYFHTPTTTRHLANMEWWWFNKGRVQYTTPRQIQPGRYGDADRILGVLTAAGGGPAIGVQMTQSNLFPFPGIWDQDDNRDANEGGITVATAGGGGQNAQFMHPLALNGRGRFWTAASPKTLDLVQAIGATDPNRWLRYSGIGLGYDGNVSGTGNVAWLNPFTGGLMNVGGAASVVPVVGVNFANPNMSSGNELVDDPNELVLDSKYIQRPFDEPLDAKDSLLLFMNPSDRNRTGVSSRVLDLMPGNISPTAGSNFYQLEVAKRFTTESWDTKQFALPRFIGGVGADLQPGVAGKDDNQDGTVDDQNERGWPGSDDDRAWEYNVDFDGNGLLEFPPQFTGGSGTEKAYQSEDPFRPQLRRLLTVEFGNTDSPRGQSGVAFDPNRFLGGNTNGAMRLNINEFLDVEHKKGQLGNPYSDQLQYRPLTPHSTDSTLTSLPAANPLPTYPPNTEGEKEFWARRDRQQMARDIYVLLYTFCGGNDGMNVTSTAGDTAYHGKVRRQMAQFAVNLVDAMDRDNVITAFEYDDNLADGWNLDDDFSTNDSSVATFPASSRRFVVFGVEAQELTISEVLWLQQGQASTNNTFTPFDETTGRTNFFHIELRSVKPDNLALGNAATTSVNTGVWQILRDDNGNGTLDAPTVTLTENAFVFMNSAGSVTPGALFDIASSDSTPVGSGALYIDHSGAATDFELVSPNKTAPAYVSTPPATPAPNLDLLHMAHAGRFILANGSAGDLLSRNNFPRDPSDATGMTEATTTNLALQRRLNPYLPLLVPTGLPPNAFNPLNPYVTVDEFRNVQKRDLRFDGGPMSTPPAVTTQAQAASRISMSGAYANPNISAQERVEPLDGLNVQNSGGAAPSPYKNTIGQKNEKSPAVFNYFQPHFDRDFASVIELFDIPLGGPVALTSLIADSRRPPSLFDDSGATVIPKGQLQIRGGPLTFGAAVLLQSEDRDGDGTLLTTSDDTNNNGFQDGAETDSNGYPGFDFGEDLNRNSSSEPNPDAHPYHFHRLLSLIEVSTRTHRQLGDPLKVNRVAGKINLNGVRDPRVLAGLIDERQVFGPPERTGVDLDTDGRIETGLQDLLGDQTQDSSGTNVQRDWWFQFLIARDGLDPTTSLPLPISGFSRPFRDVGYLRYDQEFGDQSSIEDTILRELPGAIKYTGSNGMAKGKGKAKGRKGGGSGSQGPTDGRRLFELATDNEFENGSLEPMMRHRLLSKIIGNTTTRSNVFVIHATVGMFACKEYANGAVRIGGEMDVDRDGQPDHHRAIFIVDRSALEEAYDKGSRTFDWKKLLKARLRIN